MDVFNIKFCDGLIELSRIQKTKDLFNSRMKLFSFSKYRLDKQCTINKTVNLANKWNVIINVINEYNLLSIVQFTFKC